MLSDYVRFLAWLGTAPQSRDRKALDAAEPVTRLKRMEADGIVPIMPPLAAPYIVEFLMEVGPIEPSGMEGGPVSWTTLYHWQQQVGITLQPWELRLIRTLSAEYLDQMRKSRDPDCPAPWGGITDDHRAAVSAKISALFGGLARNKA